MNPKDASTLVRDLSPNLSFAVECYVAGKQTPRQIEKRIKSRFGESAIPSLCRQAAEHYRKES